MRPGSTLQGLRGMLGAAAARLWRTMWSGPAGGSWDTTLVGKAYAEFTGCMIFHFIGSVASSAAAANSVALMVLVYYTAKISGGHLNPSVTLTFTLLGHTNPVEMLVYWAAQIAGCIAGGLWVAALVPQLRVGEHASSSPNSRSGCVSPQQDLTDVQVFGWEAVATFCFLVPVFSVVWYTQQKSGYGNTGPIMVGLALYAVALAAGDWSGAFVNPARVLGSHAVFNCDSTSRVPYYVAGQLLGACVAPFVIVPWYGLASNPWYFAIPTVRRWLLGHQPDAAATATSAEDLPPVVLLAKGRANSIDLGSGVQTSRLSMPSSQSPIQAGNLSAAAASSALTRGSPEKRYRCVVPELATSRRIRLHVSSPASSIMMQPLAVPPPAGACPSPSMSALRHSPSTLAAQRHSHSSPAEDGDNGALSSIA